MIVCAAIKDNQTGAVFGGIRHGDIYSAMHDANITRKYSEVIEGFWIVKIIFWIDMKLTKRQLLAAN